RCVEMDRFFSPSAHAVYKREDWSKLLTNRVSADMNHLPRQPVPVLEPPVSLAERVRVERHQDLPARQQLFPDRIDFFVCAAPDMERHRWIEFDERTCTDRHKRLPGKLEGNDVAVTGGRAGQGFHICDRGAWKQRNIELSGFAGQFVEPQMGGDVLHSV